MIKNLITIKKNSNLAMPKVSILKSLQQIQVIKYIEKQDERNELIKEFSRTNYDAALQWIKIAELESVKRNYSVKSSRDQLKIINFNKVSEVD